MLALSEWMKGACDFRVFCLVEKDFSFFWGLAYLGVCVVLLAWVFASCFLRGCLRFASCVGVCVLLAMAYFASCVGICASRGFSDVNGRQWPLMVVNVFLVDYAPMRVDGFATA